MINEGKAVDPKDHIMPEPDITWDHCLTGKVGVLVLEEVDQIRNTDTQTYKTMESLQAEFNVLMSATPSFNQFDDANGIAPNISG